MTNLPPEITGEQRIPSGEYAPPQRNGGLLACLAKKWGPYIVMLAAGGAAVQAFRSCIVVGADVVGIQTTEKAEKHAEKNVESHNIIWKSIEKIEAQSQEAADNSATIIKAMPPSWKRRVNK
jgi:D-arabinose 1-dehydrogenase-like Zn-dependent alcohol dehydrogenase